MTTAATMTTAAFKVKLKTYHFFKLSVQRCEERMLEHRYTNFTIMIFIKVKVCDRHEMTDIRAWDDPPCNCQMTPQGVITHLL